MLNKYPLVLWISAGLCLNPVIAFSDPCLPKTGAVSGLIQQYEGTVKPLTRQLLRPTHEDFVKAVNNIQCDSGEYWNQSATYSELLSALRFRLGIFPKDITPFKDDGAESTDELLSIYIYTADNCYNQINDRTETGNTQDIQAYLDMTQIALNRLPPYRGMVMRGSNLNGIGDAHKKGEVIRYRNFISTSKQNQFLHKQYQLLIHSETGRYVAPFSASPQEEEVLFAPGATFQVQERIKPTIGKSNERDIAPKKMSKNKWNPDPSDPNIQAVIVLKEVPQHEGKALLLPPLTGSQP